MARDGYIKTTFKQWCIEKDKLNCLELWDYELNSVSPDEINYLSREKYYFKCSDGAHPSELKAPASIKSCGKVICKACESFGQWLINEYGEDAIIELWGDKNTKDPFAIGKCHNGKVWIKCNKHQYPIEFEAICSNYVKNKNCSVCTNNYIIEGVNDVLTTHPHVEKYIVDKDIVRELPYASNIKIKVRCPDCGLEKEMDLSKLTDVNRGFSCQRCGDGNSYSERFLVGLLESLKVKYKWQPSSKVLKWCENKRYDFYIPDYNAIIEAHGMQHYSYTGFENNIEDEQRNDAYKERLAVENGVVNYIVLDCRYSELEWIKSSIMNSKFPELLNFKEEDVEWEKIAINSNFSNVVNVCRAWNSGKTTESISNDMGLNRVTVIKYLHRGKEVGLCEYNPVHTNGKYAVIDGKRVCKKVMCDGIDIKFDTIVDLIEYMYHNYGVKFLTSKISAVCNGKRSHHKGYTFRYVE